MSVWQVTENATTAAPLGSLHDDSNGAALAQPIWPANQGVTLTLLTAAQAQALQNPAPTPAQTLADQVAALVATYTTAIAQPVSFTTAAGVTKTYQADPQSRQNVADMLNAYTHAGALPAGFYWVAEDNTQVPFTLADLQGLAAELGAQGWAAFQALQAGKKALGAA